MLLDQCDHAHMDYPVTLQEALRLMIERRVKKIGRDQVATALGFDSAAGLDYLRAGGRKRKDGSWMPSFVSFEHMESLAKAEGASLEDMLKEVAYTVATMELERGPQRTAPSAGATEEKPEDL